MKTNKNNLYTHYFPKVTGKYNESFQNLLKTYFEHEERALMFQQEVEFLRKKFTEDQSINRISRYKKYQNTPSFMKIIGNPNDVDTKDFMGKRIAFLNLVFVQRFDIGTVREMLMPRRSDTDEYALTYFDHTLKFHFPKGYDLDEYVHLVLTYLINPIHGLSSKDLKAVKLLTDTLSGLEIELIQEFGPSMV